MAWNEFITLSKVRAGLRGGVLLVAGVAGASLVAAQEATPAANESTGWGWWLLAFLAILAFIWYWLFGRKSDADIGSGTNHYRDTEARGQSNTTTSNAVPANTAAPAASTATPIRSSLMSGDESAAARQRAEDARIAAEKAAMERLSAARRAAEEAAKSRASAAVSTNPEDGEVAAPAKKKATSVNKATDLGATPAKAKRKAPSKAPAKKAAKPKAPAVSDITLVDGIGPKLKKDLAAEGINSLSDLSKLSAAAIAALDAKIPRDAEQIADWVQQAKDLLAGKAPRAATDRARKAAKK